MDLRQEIAEAAVRSLSTQLEQALINARSRGKAVAVGPIALSRSGDALDGVRMAMTRSYTEVAPTDPVPVGWTLYQ